MDPAGSPAGGTHFQSPYLLKIQVFVSGSRLPYRGNPFPESPFVENTSFCVRKQAPLPGEPIFRIPICTTYRSLCPEAGSPTGGTHFQSPYMLKIQAVVSGSGLPYRGTLFSETRRILRNLHEALDSLNLTKTIEALTCFCNFLT